jgi:hypothetical protein
MLLSAFFCQVLRGISFSDWPNIAQIVIEVHDVCEGEPGSQMPQPPAQRPLGRLETVLALLKKRGFSVIKCEQQLPSLLRSGYLSFVPDSLRLFIVYATRAPARKLGLPQQSKA